MPEQMTEIIIEIRRLQGIEARAKWWLEQIKGSNDIPNDEKQFYIDKIELILGTQKNEPYSSSTTRVME